MNTAVRFPVLSPSPFWRWQVLGWLGYGVAMYLAAAQALGFSLALINKSVNVTIGFSLSLGLRWLYLQLRDRGIPPARTLPVMLGACFIAGAFWSLIANTFFWWFVHGDLATMGAGNAFAWTLVHTMVFVAWCALYVGATAVRDLRHSTAAPALDAPGAAPAPLVVRADGELLRLPQDQIHSIEAARNYSCIVSESGTHVVRVPLSTLAARLDARHFIRVHRSAIVAVGRLKSLRGLPTQDAIVTLTGGREIRVSRGFRAQVERALGARH